MNYARFLNKISAARQPSLIREMAKVLASAPPSMIPLSGGFPNPEMFPFSHLSITIPGHSNMGSEATSSTIELSGSALQSALQYLPTPGHPGLLQQLGSLQQTLHSPQPGVDMVVTQGARDGLCRALEMLVSPGTGVLVEEYVDSTTLSMLGPLQPRLHPVQADQLGMRPDSLRRILTKQQQQEEEQGPRLLYISPTGNNPTGTVLPLDRRREVLELCSEHDLLVLEEDPHHLLQYGDQADRQPSLLSLDTEGRVLRFDSLATVLSPGIGLGFVTGPKPLIERIVLHMQVSVPHASSLSQELCHQVLAAWGQEGFLRHCKQVETFYRHRRDALMAAADKHLVKPGLCEYSVPLAGTSLWIKIPTLTSTWEMVMHRGRHRNLALMPGRAFQPDPRQPCQHIQADFSTAPEDKFDTAMMQLARLIDEELELGEVWH